MNRHEALEFLHARHPRMVAAPGDGPCDLGSFHYDIFEFQMRICDRLDRRSKHGLRRCFASVLELLERGDREVRAAVSNDFFFPHLVFNKELEWAKTSMPPRLREITDRAVQLTREEEERCGRGRPSPP